MYDLEEMIIAHEGIRLKPYLDTLGNLTVGVGRNLDDRGISKDEALYLMRNDIEMCISQLSKYIWYIEQPTSVQHALIDMCFNIGINRLLGFKKMIMALTVKDYTKAAIEALDSRWATQVGSRAQDVALMIRGGV